MLEKIRIRVAVVLQEGDKLLLVQHEKKGNQYWLLPGGGLEFGETIEACALRELREETNLSIQLGDLLFINESIPPDHDRHVLNLYYEGKILDGILRVGQDHVLKHAEFMDMNKIPELVFYPNVKKELLEYLKSKKRINKISLGNRWE